MTESNVTEPEPVQSKDLNNIVILDDAYTAYIKYNEKGDNSYSTNVSNPVLAIPKAYLDEDGFMGSIRIKAFKKEYLITVNSNKMGPGLELGIRTKTLPQGIYLEGYNGAYFDLQDQGIQDYLEFRKDEIVLTKKSVQEQSKELKEQETDPETQNKNSVIKKFKAAAYNQEDKLADLSFAETELDPSKKAEIQLVIDAHEATKDILQDFYTGPGTYRSYRNASQAQDKLDSYEIKDLSKWLSLKFNTSVTEQELQNLNETIQKMDKQGIFEDRIFKEIQPEVRDLLFRPEKP